jgi:branched-chain amino acid aminotransferase
MVSEGAGQNLFLIRNGVLYTPPGTASILQGLTRDTVFFLAKQLGYEVREEPISRESLYLADEFFMCGTATEVVPVKSVDGIAVGNGSRGPMTEAIQTAFFGIFDGSTEVPENWLDAVL